MFQAPAANLIDQLLLGIEEPAPEERKSEKSLDESEDEEDDDGENPFAQSISQ